MRYLIKAIENLVTFRNHHLSQGVGSFEEFNEDQMVFSGNEREIANGVYKGGGKGGTIEKYTVETRLSGPRLSGPRLSGLFDYPDFLLRSQFFHEY